MFVSRSEVSCRDSIHLDSRVTGANAMSSSDEGSGPPSSFERTNLSVNDGNVTDGSDGFHSVAGASVASIATLRGPVRRSRYGAIDSRQESAACWRSAGVIVTCINFSASAKVAGVTTGPAPLPVPNVGGAPAGGAVVCVLAGGGVVSLRQAEAATSRPSGARRRNCRRVFIGRGDYSQPLTRASRSGAPCLLASRVKTRMPTTGDGILVRLQGGAQNFSAP